MQTFGATVTASPSMSTRAGKDIITRNPNYQGSLGTAISEAIELAMSTPNCKYTLVGIKPCHTASNGYRSGSRKANGNGRRISRHDYRLLWWRFQFWRNLLPLYAPHYPEWETNPIHCCRTASCPKLTRGKFQYDFGDEAGYTPLLPMFTLGHNFSPANIHAGGLRYHGAGVIVSQLLKDNLMEAVDIQQLESFQAGCLFAQAEGIIPAPESCMPSPPLYARRTSARNPVKRK